jgi:hypothetical protein
MTTKVAVDLYASVGGGDKEFLGTVQVPITSSKDGESLILDLSRPFRRMKNAVEWFDPNKDDEA